MNNFNTNSDRNSDSNFNSNSNNNYTKKYRKKNKIYYMIYISYINNIRSMFIFLKKQFINCYYSVKEFFNNHSKFIYEIVDKIEKEICPTLKPNVQASSEGNVQASSEGNVSDSSEGNVSDSDVISKQVSQEELTSSFTEISDVKEPVENNDENFEEIIDKNSQEGEGQTDTPEKTSLFRRILNRILNIIRRKNSK